MILMIRRLSLLLLQILLLFGSVVVIHSFVIIPTGSTPNIGSSRSRSSNPNNNNNNGIIFNNNNHHHDKLIVKMAYNADDGGAPSDYDRDDILGENEKVAVIDTNEEDSMIRDALKRELLLLSSITNRGEYTTIDEQNILIDIVAQLEALNPTTQPTSNMIGIWDLCLSSTQFFRSSPFFQSIRTVMGDANKLVIQNAFDIHDRATTASRIGRVRQIIEQQQKDPSSSSLLLLTSEVDLEVGIVPGLPFRVKGTVVTKATIKVTSIDTFELQITTTNVKGSNIPIINQFLDDNKELLQLPIGQLYNTITGSIPVVVNKIFYLDESMKIIRDQDDNFFIYTRA